MLARSSLRTRRNAVVNNSGSSIAIGKIKGRMKVTPVNRLSCTPSTLRIHFHAYNQRLFKFSDMCRRAYTTNTSNTFQQTSATNQQSATRTHPKQAAASQESNEGFNFSIQTPDFLVPHNISDNPYFRLLKNRIITHIKAKQYEEVTQLVENENINMRRNLWPLILLRYCTQELPQHTFVIFEKMKRDGSYIDYCRILAMLGSMGMEKEFNQYWDEMVSKNFKLDSVCYVLRIKLLCALERFDEALETFYAVEKEGFVFDHHVFNVLVKYVADKITGDTTDPNQAELQEKLNTILELINQRGMQWTDIIGNALIRMHVRKGDINAAHAVLEKLGDSRDSGSYFPIVQYHVQKGHIDTAISLIQQAAKDHVFDFVDKECVVKDFKKLVLTLPIRKPWTAKKNRYRRSNSDINPFYR